MFRKILAFIWIAGWPIEYHYLAVWHPVLHENAWFRAGSVLVWMGVFCVLIVKDISND